MPIAALGSHRCPLKHRRDIGAAPAARFAGELGLQVGQANVVIPFGGIDDNRVRAFEVAAVDEQPGRAVAGPHFPEGDFLDPLHRLILPRIRPNLNKLPRIVDTWWRGPAHVERSHRAPDISIGSDSCSMMRIRSAMPCAWVSSRARMRCR